MFAKESKKAKTIFTEKRLKRVKDIIKHKGCQKSHSIKLFKNFFNITNKSIIFISKSC